MSYIYFSYRCVYSENDVTVLENKVIEAISLHFSKKRKLSSIDLCEPKRISCEINPLYYSLAHYEDFSSSEFSDFEQFTYDDIELPILNRGTIGNSFIANMDITSNDSTDPHLNESQSNSACKESFASAKRNNFLGGKYSVNFNTDLSDVSDKGKSENNLNNKLCDLKKNPNISNDKNNCLNSELAVNYNNTLASPINIQRNESTGSLANEYVKNSIKDCVSSFSLKDSNEEKIGFNNDKMIQDIDDDLDVVSLQNFETFTIIKRNNEIEDVFSKYNGENNTNKSDQDSLKDDQSINFQTFTVINEDPIIDDLVVEKDLVVSNETEIANDYKTFTVVNGINTSPFHTEKQCTSSNHLLSTSKRYINNNDIINLDTLTHTPSQYETITLLPQLSKLSNHQNEKKEIDDSPKSLENNKNECNVSNVVFEKNGISEHNESCNQINILPEENTRKEIINYSNTFEGFVTSKDSILCTNLKECSDILPSKLCTDDNLTLNCISKDNNQGNNSLNCQPLEKLKSSGESDSTLSLHLEILETNQGINSPDSLNDDEVFGQEEKPIVSNKLEFVPLEATSIRDNRSPRLSRKYMECSPVMSANACVPDVEKSSTVEENSERRNSSSFFIDFNEGKAKPKNKPKRFENLTKSLDSSTIATSKEKIFSMFIDFNEDSESSESSKSTKHRKPQTLADRFVRMHSEDTSVKNTDHEDTVTPPPSRMTSTVENSTVDISESYKKQSVFMFIENDSPAPVKRRSLPQSSRLKSQRNSWNVDSTVIHKTHHRTHSVNLSEDSHLDARMTQSHIETGSKEFNKPSDSFNNVECNVTITINNSKNCGIGLADSFVRLSDMDKAPSQEVVNNLSKSESKSESLRKDLKNTELGRCLKRMFPYLKSTEVERILLSKPPQSLDNKEDIRTGLGKDLLRMFLEEIGADTTIDVNGRRIKAHKCVLISRCQYFAAMFSGGWVQSAGNVLYLKG